MNSTNYHNTRAPDINFSVDSSIEEVGGELGMDFGTRTTRSNGIDELRTGNWALFAVQSYDSGG